MNHFEFIQRSRLIKSGFSIHSEKILLNGLLQRIHLFWGKQHFVGKIRSFKFIIITACAKITQIHWLLLHPLPFSLLFFF